MATACSTRRSKGCLEIVPTIPVVVPALVPVPAIVPVPVDDDVEEDDEDVLLLFPLSFLSSSINW